MISYTVQTLCHVKMNIYVKIGSLIMKARRDRGLSQEDLAFSCGVSQAWINKVELGKSKISIEFLYRVSNSLNCDVSIFLPSEK